jgi:hypothetical protein
MMHTYYDNCLGSVFSFFLSFTILYDCSLPLAFIAIHKWHAHNFLLSSSLIGSIYTTEQPLVHSSPLPSHQCAALGSLLPPHQRERNLSFVLGLHPMHTRSPWFTPPPTPARTIVTARLVFNQIWVNEVNFHNFIVKTLFAEWWIGSSTSVQHWQNPESECHFLSLTLSWLFWWVVGGWGHCCWPSVLNTAWITDGGN